MPARASFGMPTASAICKQVEEGSAPECLDLTNNTSFRMKPTESVEMLVEALAKNGSNVTKLIMKECEIGDPACEAISALLKKNHTIVELDLEKNRISPEGAVTLADGLAENRGLKTLNLLNQGGGKNFGEECLMKYREMFNTNTTLTKIIWRLQSRQSFALNKLITRNGEIQRRLESGRDVSDILPDGVKEVPAGGAAPAKPPPAAAKPEAAKPEPVKAPEKESPAPASPEAASPPASAPAQSPEVKSPPAGETAAPPPVTGAYPSTAEAPAAKAEVADEAAADGAAA